MPEQDAVNEVAPAWFGCVDLKYAGEGSVKILELGDGHTSGFTGAGAFIPHAFTKLGAPRRTLGALMDNVLENKILTHDALCDAGLIHLRPRVGVFPRTHRPGLAAAVLDAVGGGHVVLKLADRQRGCGVVAAEPDNINDTLARLLGPPEQADGPTLPHGNNERGLPAEWATIARRAAALGGLTEAATHWCADECPDFLAEELCRSKLVQGYDGTLRIGFAVEETRVQLLGAYWKLPDVAADQTQVELTSRIVSHTHGGSGTAACSREDEETAWAVLQGPLLTFFQCGAALFTVPGLMQRYEGNPLLAATALTRVAAGLIEEDTSKAERTLLLAEQLVDDGAKALRDCVQSYIRRTRGTIAARRGGPGKAPDWRAAGSFYDEAVQALPYSAAALYFAGMVRLNRGSHALAGYYFARSVAADCDYACAYNQLATCCLLLGDHGACVEVAEALLVRHGRVAAAHHHIAVALYAQEALLNEQAFPCDSKRRSRAASALKRAKELQRGKSWGANEEELLEALEGPAPLPKKPARTWLFHAWRL